MGSVKIDLSGLKKYQKELEKRQAATDDFFRSCAKELAARLLAKVIKRTPVGNKPDFDGAPTTVKVKGSRGKEKSFLSREGAILQEHWSGYVGGTLRRGWTSKTEEEAKGGKGSGKSVGEFIQNELEVEKIGNTYRITISNPVSYASYVEYGHRQTPGRYVPQIGKRLKKGWVNGQFMLTISEMELKIESPAILERKLATFLRGGEKNAQ